MADLVLVTGGAGFIGSNLTVALLERGYHVRVLDNLSTGGQRNLAGLERDVELVEGDIRDADAVRRAAAGVWGILHQAALPSVARSVADPVTSHQVNTTGTLNVLVAARDAGVQRLVYASSSSVYGDTPVLPKSEALTPRPMSPYAVSKLTGEHYVTVFSRLYGIEGVSLRYFNVFGPRQNPTSQYAAVIPRFITTMLRGEQPTVYGDGTQSRDFTYIANVVEANLRALETPGLGGEFMNIACGGRYTLLDLIAVLNRTLGRQIEPRFEPARPGDVMHSQAAIEKAERLLGFEPVVELAEGLAHTVAWFKART